MNKFVYQSSTDSPPPAPTVGQNGDGKLVSETWREGDTMHTQTTIIHKKVPAVWTILITALTFMIIGALIATTVFVARFIDIETVVDAIQRTGSSGSDNPPITATPEPITQSPDPNDSPNGNSSSIMFGEDNPIPDIYAENVDGVLIVHSYASGNRYTGELVGVGTGFVISEEGYILTNAHVISGARNVWVTTCDGEDIQAEIIGSDVRTDTAVLKIDASAVTKVLTLGNSTDVSIGDFVLAIGHPTGAELSFTATFGMVGYVDRSVNIDGVRNNYIQIDAAINPGNSGGPLFNMKGEVIGMNSAKTVIASYDEQGEPISAEGLGFALPINEVIEVANSLIADGNIVRPGIGVSVITIDEQTAAEHNIPQGALVYSVIKDGPAHLAGLYADDIITSVDGTAITDTDAFIDIILTKQFGESVEIVFWRDGETRTCTLVIGDLNAIGDEVLDGVYGGSKYGLR